MNEENLSELRPMRTGNFPKNQTVNLRLYASKRYAIIEKIPFGKRVLARKFNEGWHRACFRGERGFIMSKFLIDEGENEGKKEGESADNSGENEGSWPDAGKGLECQGKGEEKGVNEGEKTKGDEERLKKEFIALGFSEGRLGEITKQGVRLRKSPDSGEFMKLKKGARLIVSGFSSGHRIANSGLWLRVLLGKANGRSEERYVHSSCLAPFEREELSKIDRLCALAEGFLGHSGFQLGMGGAWCQRFIYFLFSSLGLKNPLLPYDEGYCGRARRRFVALDLGVFHERSEGYRPKKGDLIYYGAEKSAVSSHVGLVVRGGEDFLSIEGNLSDKVKKCEGFVSSRRCNGRPYQGFLEIMYGKF